MNELERWQIIEPMLRDILEDLTVTADRLINASPDELPELRNRLQLRTACRIGAANAIAGNSCD